MHSVTLVPGPSVRALSRWFLRVIVAMVGFGLLLTFVASFFGADLPRAVLMTGLFALFGMILGAAAVGFLGIRQSNREAAAGYTTAPTAFINLDTVDDRSGAVLRKAGEPLLTSVEYDLRVAALARDAT